MAFLNNFTFPDGSTGAGPFKADQPTPEHLAGLQRYEFNLEGRDLVFYHNKNLSTEDEIVIRKWSESQVAGWK